MWFYLWLGGLYVNDSLYWTITPAPLHSAALFGDAVKEEKKHFMQDIYLEALHAK